MCSVGTTRIRQEEDEEQAQKIKIAPTERDFSYHTAGSFRFTES
jgi:hypothetical protein